MLLCITLYVYQVHHTPGVRMMECIKSQNNHPIFSGSRGTLYTTPPAVPCLMFNVTPPIYHLGDTLTWASTQYVPPGVRVYHNIFWRPATWRRRRCKGYAYARPVAVGNTLLRRQRLLLWVRVLKARSCILCGNRTHLVVPPAAAKFPTAQPTHKHVPPRVLQRNPYTS